MADDRRLIPRLVAAERSLQDVRVPPKAVRRIADRMTRELDRVGRTRRFAWVPMLTFVAGATLVLAFLAVLRDIRDAGVQPREHEVAVRIAGPDCHHRLADEGALALSGACEVSTTSPAMRVQTVEGAELDVDDRIVHMQRGSALFDVDPVVGEPVRIVVPGGTIVVVGTRFRVVVTGEGGEVDLYEGKLEFHADDGSVSPIAAGQRFAFGGIEAAPVHAAAPVRSTPPPVIEAAPTPVQRVDRPPPLRADAIIEEVQRLRRSGDYPRAALRLREALGQRWPKRTAEVLSYELGTILARHLDDREAACTHWRKHLQRFTTTRYRGQIERSLATLACP
ncbi:MAG TPA: FecR domain-containing protein [Nannocystaceae bacterium]|nr:FecR domain-containing protein [Nannocystaceae bacterium]